MHRKREMAEDKLDPGTKYSLDLFHHWMRRAAGRTLEIGKLLHCHGGIRRPEIVRRSSAQRCRRHIRRIRCGRSRCRTRTCAAAWRSPPISECDHYRDYCYKYNDDHGHAAGAAFLRFRFTHFRCYLTAFSRCGFGCCPLVSVKAFFAVA